jgi:hypothetical protein
MYVKHDEFLLLYHLPSILCTASAHHHEDTQELDNYIHDRSYPRILCGRIVTKRSISDHPVYH